MTGPSAHALGIGAEDAACARLVREGWTILDRRRRTQAGEIDILAQRDGLLAVVEVKARRTLAEAAVALRPRQQRRLLDAAAIVLAENPDWGTAGVRFDILLVDTAGRVRRIADAFRDDG